MSAEEQNLVILTKIVIVSLILTTVSSMICDHKVPQWVTVKRNGTFQKEFIIKTTKICCEGFIRDKSDMSKCVSICPEGFNYISGSCIPYCENCYHGKCIAPNQCICNAGYTKSTHGCIPDETQSCIHKVTRKVVVKQNGQFRKRRVEFCCEGYIRDKHDVRRCVPKCQAGFDYIEGSCSPHCENCKHGKCIAPNQCKCNEGYEKSPEGCTPIQTNICTFEVVENVLLKKNGTFYNGKLPITKKVCCKDYIRDEQDKRRCVKRV